MTLNKKDTLETENSKQKPTETVAAVTRPASESISKFSTLQCFALNEHSFTLSTVVDS